MKRFVLCLPGIRTVAEPIPWRRELDAALRLEGLGDLESPGWTTVAPEYMDLLTVQPEPSDEPPASTYARPSDDQHRRAAGDYWLACSQLEAALGDGTALGPGPIADVPADQIAKRGIPLLFPYARTYCSSSRRRNSISGGCSTDSRRREMVIIGYSPGPWLPPTCCSPPEVLQRAFAGDDGQPDRAEADFKPPAPGPIVVSV